MSEFAWKFYAAVCSLTLGLTATGALAAVSAEEASELGKGLTPFGAERAGNADSSIPEWTGGMTHPPKGYQPGGVRIDPFAAEKPLMSINGSNYKSYADQLTPGMQMLFEKYPDSFRMDVYPTHRTHALPEWQYKQTLLNATRASLDSSGSGVKNAYGGVPFPIPKNGNEVIWNHLLRYNGTSTEGVFKAFVVYPNGTTQASIYRNIWQSPYYDPNGSLETFKGTLASFVNVVYEPTRRKGEYTLVVDPVNAFEQVRASWQYLPGQRRVRRAPTVAYDTPDASTAGLTTYDDAYMFNGAPDRYEWKLLGKKEMFIPYNAYKIQSALADGHAEEDVAMEKHINPDFLRWEKHRVWVVEANLKPGQRHIYKKRVFFIDEDSWYAVLEDRYDGRGGLWRTSVYNLYNTYENVGTVGSSFYHTDLISGAYLVSLVKEPLTHMEMKSDDFFTPQGLRKLGQR